MFRFLFGATVGDVAGDEPAAPDLRVEVDEPRLREKWAHVAELAVCEEVVAFGDDEGDITGHWPRACDCEFVLPTEDGCVNYIVRALVQPAEERDVATGVEGIGRALAISPPEDLQYRVVEVEAVKGDQRRPVPEPLHERLCEGRLASTRGSNDPQDRSSAKLCELGSPRRERIQ